jgi:hypothetical protein
MTLMGNEPALQLGDSGEHVTQLQDRLRGLGLLDKQPDGTYDDATQTAVRQFQSNLGLENDGEMTPEAWQTLDQHMLSNGLTYNHFAGPANQHWDAQAAEPGLAHEAAHQYEYEHQDYGNSYESEEHSHEQTHTAEAEAGGAAAASSGHEAGTLSPDGMWKWNGHDWEAAEGQGQAPAAEEAPVIPHFDNIHPAIQQDERFSDFHDFLRENSAQ